MPSGRTNQPWSSMAPGMQPRTPQPGGPGYGNMPGSPSMQQYMYERMRSSPQRDRQYYPTPKMKKSSSSMNNQSQQRRDVVFPSDSVEATQPRLVKRKRLTAKDIAPVEAWKVMMALKSGLLAESSWALDTLSVLLFDDHTVTYFSLTHLPGLLEALLDHFRQCLKQIFKLCKDFETLKMPEMECEENEENYFEIPFLSQNCSNYTWETRQGKAVKLEDSSKDEIFISDKKDWDLPSNIEFSVPNWQIEPSELSDHVLICFRNQDMSDVMKKKYYGKHYGIHCTRKSESACMQPVSNCEDCCEKSSDICSSNRQINDIQGLKETKQLINSPDNKAHDSPENKMNDSPDIKARDSPDIKANDTDKMGNESFKTDSSPPFQCKQEKNGSQEFVKDCDEKMLKEKFIKQEPASETEKVIPKGGIDPEMEQRILKKLKRKWSSHQEIETEAYHRDNPPLFLISESHEELSKRCICVSNILRSFSFIPGNDYEMSRHYGLVRLLGWLLMLHHTHPIRKVAHRPFDREEISSDNAEDYVEDNREEWWWDTLDALRENTLVVLANIAGQMNMTDYPEEICFPVLDGMLHWATCQASCAQDPMPTMSLNSVLSPQRLVLEAMCKLCVHEDNVDLILATPPFGRIVKLIGSLVKHLSNSKEQVMREFSIVLLSSLVQGDSCAARAVALQTPSISLFLDFLETAERQAMLVAKSQGLNMLRENPEMMGTSLDMLRRAATTLKFMAMVPENHALFLHHEQRILDLVTSQILDQQVAAILSNVLYNCSISVT